MSPAPISSSTSSTAAIIWCMSASGAEASTTCTIRSAPIASSSVAEKASTSWCGSLRMKPTVSVSRYWRPEISNERVVGSSVWKSRSRTPTSEPVIGVQQRGLAGVRVAGERHRREPRALALAAHRGARGLRLAQAAPQRRDAVARQPAVGLDLRLARAPGADAAVHAAGAEALEVRPQAAHAREVVLELRELHLELALGRAGVVGEDVEDDRRAVDHRHAELLLEVALLARQQLVVHRDQVGVRLLHGLLQLGELAAAEVAVRIRALAALDHLARDRHAGGAEQLTQLGEVGIARARHRWSERAGVRAGSSPF